LAAAPLFFPGALARVLDCHVVAMAVLKRTASLRVAYASSQ
jgi:hypothetical protein